MLDTNSYSTRKGIYKDLYKAIDAQNSVQPQAPYRRERKGIYKDLYKQFEADKKQDIKQRKPENQNILKRLPLKLLAYTSNVGEALKPVLGAMFAKLSWIPSILYAILAVITNSSNTNSQDDKNKSKKTTREILYQVFASFILPDIAVKTSRHVSNKFIDIIPEKTKLRVKNFSEKITWIDKLIKLFKKDEVSAHRNFALSAIGIGSLALAVRPINNVVNSSLNKLYSPKDSLYYERR